MKHWDIIQQQPKLKHIFNQPPIVSYKENSLVDILVRENFFNLATITKSMKRLKENENLAICLRSLNWLLKTHGNHASIRLLQNNRVNIFWDLLNLSLIILITNVEAEDLQTLLIN